MQKGLAAGADTRLAAIPSRGRYITGKLCLFLKRFYNFADLLGVPGLMVRHHEEP